MTKLGHYTCAECGAKIDIDTQWPTGEMLHAEHMAAEHPDSAS
jgi:hypothetical protein